MTTRIDTRFAECAAQNRPALVTFVMAGDPDRATSQAILDGLPRRRRRHHRTGHAVFRSHGRRPGHPARRPARPHGRPERSPPRSPWSAPFAAPGTPDTPIILMGYYNPIYIYGVARFVADCVAPGVDGLIVVDLPAEEDERTVPAGARGRAQLHPPDDADHRRPAPAGRAEELARASSTTCR